MPQIGRFFSLQQGRVGQYLSTRVLVVRSPFQAIARTGDPSEVCYFGFDTLAQVQKFARYLSGLGSRFQIQQRQMLRQYPYEIQLVGNAALARMLAHWERTEPQPDRSSILSLPAPGFSRASGANLAA